MTSRRPGASGAAGFLPLVALIMLLSACSPSNVPTQARPECSWSSDPPANSAAVCDHAFTTLSKLAGAEQTGKDAAVAHLVTDPATAGRIRGYGASLRAQGVRGLHVVPSFTMTVVQPGLYGAGFYLLGTSRKGRILASETVYLAIQGGRAIVRRDQPGEEW